MFRSFFSVGAATALSRLTGFVREMVLAALLGQGALADAYATALKLPNQFRAIFGEGAFNAAYVPTYSRLLSSHGPERATTFASRILTLLAISQLILLALAFAYTPAFVMLIAPGFDANPQKFAATVTMTRIMFPYLAFITIATLNTGTLNANGFFLAGAIAPVLLNVFIVGFLAVAFLFPNAAIAASWGVVVSGAAQLALLVFEARRRGVLERFAWPRLEPDVRQFFRALGPAVVGSAGQQIAIFVDQILASGMPDGSVASIGQADRLYQLPLGMIGVAAGTVLLPEISRRLARGDEYGAAQAQNRSIALSLALCAPFLVGFVMIPEALVRGAYMRGLFDAVAALRSSRVLEAYAFGLIPMVLIRSSVAPFQARGDTKTPMYCFFAGLAFNVLLKIGLAAPLGPMGLAIGTAVGAWINFALLTYLGRERGLTHPDDRLYENMALMAFAAAGAAFATPYALAGAAHLTAGLHFLRNEAVATLAFCALSLVYGLLYVAGTLLFGRGLRRQLS